jgi:hypothetical protein
VISGGKILGEGETSEVLKNSQLLGAAGLEPLSIAKRFSELKAAGLVDDVPITIRAGILELRGLLEKK